MNLKWMSLGLIVLVAGCSNSDSGSGGSNVGPLNSKLTDSATQAFSGQTALFEASRGASQRSGQRTFFGASFDRTASTSAAKAKTSKVNQAIQSTACKIDLTQPATDGSSGGAAAEFKPMKMKISGASCPVEINMEMTMLGAGGAKPCSEAQGVMTCRFTANVKMSYQVLDQKLARELEVVSGHTNMKFEMDQTLPANQTSPNGAAGGAMVMKGNGAFDLKAVDIQGQAHLVSGTQDINLKMLMPQGDPSAGPQPMPQMFGGMKEDLRYLEESSGISSALNSTLVFNGGAPEEKYLVDGNPVSAQDYQSERDKFANSMMAFGSKSESDQQTEPVNPTPGPGPAPVPNPGPGPAPMPGPAPVPAPVPANDRQWVCVIESYSNHDVFAGYGAIEFTAKSKAEQACRNSSANACSSNATCEQQELNPQAWYCQTKNYSSGRLFGAAGASKTEAAYLANQDCFVSSGSDQTSCAGISSSTCAHQ
jgi:hypothetical protein